MAQRFYCNTPEGRQILGKFYDFGDPIIFEDDQLDLAYAHQKAEIIKQGDFTGQVPEKIPESSEESENNESEESIKTTRKKKGPQ